MKTPIRILLFLLLPAMNTTGLTAQEMMSLAGAVTAGLENNFGILISRNEALVAENNNTPGYAGFLPTLNLTANQNNTITNTHQETFAGSVKDISGAKNRTFNTGLQLGWTLFDGFSMFVNRNSLGVLERMGETEARLTVENTVTAIILGYYGLVQQEKLISVLEDAAALSRERKAIMEARFNLGAGSELMLLQSTVDLNADSINLLQAMASLERGRADFNLLLARDPETAFMLTDSIPAGEKLDYEELAGAASRQNTELRLARFRLELDMLNIKSLQSQRYPRLNFNAAYSYSQLNSQTGFLEYNRSLGPSFGLSLSYALFDGFNVNREIKNARIRMNSGELALQSIDLETRNDIYKQYADYLSNLKIVEIETVNREVAQRNVDAAYEKYRLGSLSDIELRETQKKYIDSQYQLLLSQFLVKKAEVELLRLSGGLEIFLAD